MNNNEIPKRQDAISCYFCKHYFLIEKDDEQLSSCSKHDFVFSLITNGFSTLFSKCESFEESGSKR